MASFQVDRGEDYAEFCERADALLTEIKNGAAGKKFTFAELEEAGMPDWSRVQRR